MGQMEKSRNQTCSIKKFSITLRTNKNTRECFILTLASLLKRASVQCAACNEELCAGEAARGRPPAAGGAGGPQDPAHGQAGGQPEGEHRGVQLPDWSGQPFSY